MGEGEDVMSTPHRAKETYQELRTALPPLLPGYLAAQRWFGGKARQIRAAEITDIVPLNKIRFEAFVLLVRLEYTTGPGETYVLPLICTEEPIAENAATGLKVHSAARGTYLHLRNALTDDGFLRSLLDAIEKKAAFSGSEGEIRASYKWALDQNPALAPHWDPSVQPLFQSALDPWAIPDASLGTVFASNFMEHFTLEDANTIAMLLRSGTLPGRLIVVEQQVVEPDGRAGNG